MLLGLRTAMGEGIRVADVLENESHGRRDMKRASGSFDVSVQPLANADFANEDGSSNPLLGRFLLIKKFSGDLDARARGHMLSAGTATKGSAGYVAIDQITGVLHGRRGSFVLQHSGSMKRGAPTLSVMVVPDSGTGELAGLTGTLNINIVEGKHFYDFLYSIPAS